MGEVFKGWRRKVGCVTLVMALLTFCVWGFGHSALVGYTIFTGEHRIEMFGSSSNGFFWTVIDGPEESWATPGYVSTGWHFRYVPSYDCLDHIEIDWHWQCCGFHSANGKGIQDVPQTAFVVPHWSIILPMTLLSAFLLLTKPRKSAPKKNHEPILTVGA